MPGTLLQVACYKICNLRIGATSSSGGGTLRCASLKGALLEENARMENSRSSIQLEAHEQEKVRRPRPCTPATKPLNSASKPFTPATKPWKPANKLCGETVCPVAREQLRGGRLLRQGLG